MLTEKDIKRLEQVWLVLSDFFQDLNRKNTNLDVASDLRDCKTLIHFLRTSVAQPPKETVAIDHSLQNLLQILDKIRSNLISEATRFDEKYVKEWMEKVDKAERTELGYKMLYDRSEFVPDLPKDHERGWIRLSLQKPVAEERMQDVAEQFGVIIELKNNTHILISGRRDSVRKATRDVYELSLEETSLG